MSPATRASLLLAALAAKRYGWPGSPKPSSRGPGLRSLLLPRRGGGMVLGWAPISPGWEERTGDSWMAQLLPVSGCSAPTVPGLCGLCSNPLQAPSEKGSGAITLGDSTSCMAVPVCHPCALSSCRP